MLRSLAAIAPAAQRSHWHQSLGAALVEGDEEPESADSRNPSRELRTLALGHERGDEAVAGLPLGGGGAAFRGRDLLPDRGEVIAGARLQPVLAQPARRDQAAVNQQIGVTANR